MTRLHAQVQGKTWQESLPGAANGNGLSAALTVRGYVDTPELERCVEAAARWVEHASDAQRLLAQSDPELGQAVLKLATLHDRGTDA
jgi:hypothetical protein